MRRIDRWFCRGLVVAALLAWQPLARAADCASTTATAAVGDGTISYRVAGNGPDVVLLHGLFAQKEQWDGLLCALAAAGYRVTAPDLPGYAQSSGYGIDAYALENQAELIDQFLSSRGIGRFHLAGSSLGGAVAAIYAHRHRQRVLSLAFIGGALGVGDWAAPVRRAIGSGVNPFIPLDAGELDIELRLLLVNVPQLSAEVKQAIVAPYVAETRHYRQVWDIVNLYGRALLSLPRNRVPALIVWGRDDQVFDVAGMKPLAGRFPDNRRVVLDAVGHLPMLDAPEKTAGIYVDFLHGAPAR